MILLLFLVFFRLEYVKFHSFGTKYSDVQYQMLFTSHNDYLRTSALGNLAGIKRS